MSIFSLTSTTLTGMKPVYGLPVKTIEGGFRGTGVANVDAFYHTPVDRDQFIANSGNVEFENESKIIEIAKNSPRVMELLKEHKILKSGFLFNVGVEDVVNIEALKKLRDGHLKSTLALVNGMYDKLPEELKSQVNLSDLQVAAKLHDYGKVLIPKQIYEKQGSFTPEEKKIMELHSELGHELLKAQGVKESVCKLVKYHHQRPDGSGYPAIKDSDDFEYGISSQMLAAADKYSALTESRCYRKEKCTRVQALSIIQEDVKAGLISQEVFDALINASAEYEKNEKDKEESKQKKSLQTVR